MRKIFAVALLWIMSAASVLALSLAKPVGFVNDFANVLTTDERATLESRLQQIEASTSNQIVVVTVSSFDGLDAFLYSQKLFTEWGIGQKNKNNGVLMLLGPKEGLPFPERGEMFINVGKGLEGALPDSVTGSILRAEIIPSFKLHKYADGLTRGVAAIDAATKGEYKADAQKSSNGKRLPIDLFIWIGFFLFTYLGSFLARSKSWWFGGIIGGVAGTAVGFIFFAGLSIIFSVIGLGLLGLLFDFIVSRNYIYRKEHGLPTTFGRSGGGFWWGGGGGSSGGGFGGFGGGSSGGGGAGGSW